MKIIKFFNFIDRIAVGIAIISLFVMMVLITMDSLARSVLNNPIVGVLELTEKYLMVSFVFLSLSYTMKKNGHIRIDLFLNKLSGWTLFLLESFGLAAGMVLFVGVAYQGVLSTLEAYTHNYVETGVIPWPLWLSLIWVPIGSLLLIGRIIIYIMNLFQYMKESKPAKKESEDNKEEII